MNKRKICLSLVHKTYYLASVHELLYGTESPLAPPYPYNTEIFLAPLNLGL